MGIVPRHGNGGIWEHEKAKSASISAHDLGRWEERGQG